MGEELRGTLEMGVLINEDGNSLGKLATAIGDITVKKEFTEGVKIERLYKELMGLAEQAKELNFSNEDVITQCGIFGSELRDLRTTMIKGSKEYKEMQREINKIYEYECSKAYLKLHRADTFIKCEVPIALKDNEILVRINKIVFAVSFDDKERNLIVSDYFYRIENNNGKMEFKKINGKIDTYDFIISNAIKFMSYND